MLKWKNTAETEILAIFYHALSEKSLGKLNMRNIHLISSYKMSYIKIFKDKNDTWIAYKKKKKHLIGFSKIIIILSNLLIHILLLRQIFN